MKYLRIILKVLWKLLFILNFVLGLLILYPLFYILLSRKAWFPKAFQLKKIWAHWILIIPGIFTKTKYETGINELPHPAVYCANHTSYLDIVLYYIVVPNYFISMGKQELNKAPLFRIFFREMNILVDRKSKSGSHKAFLRAGAEIKKGNSVFIFPEGGISSSGTLLNFKNGAFKLAIENQVPIIPITFLNNWKHLQNGGFFKSYGKPGICETIVHSPISTIGMNENDLIPLRIKVRSLIEAELEKYNHANR